MILIKARLQTAPKFLRIKSTLDRILTHNNPQPLYICLCYTSLRRQPTKQMHFFRNQGRSYTAQKRAKEGGGVFRSTFLVNERVLEPLS